MSSRHSTLPNQTQVSESWTRKELHVHNAEVPLGRHIQPESAHKTRQEEKEWRPTSSHLAPPSKTQTPVPRSTPPGAASRNGEPQNKAYDSRANHILPTFRYSLEPERRTAPSHLAPPSKPRSPVPHSSPIPCGPSQNSERATNNYRSASIPSSSEESYSSVGSGDTSHSEYMQGSDSDSCADSDNNLVDSSESAGNESDVSVVSRGTRRDEVLHAAAQLQADAELRAAALQAEYDDADEELGRIRTSIARYKLKAEASDADIISLVLRRDEVVVEGDIVSLLQHRDDIKYRLVMKRQRQAGIREKFHSAYERGEGPKNLYWGN